MKLIHGGTTDDAHVVILSWNMAFAQPPRFTSRT